MRRWTVDGPHFDDLARLFSTGHSRRQVIKAVVAAGGTAALFGGRGTDASADPVCQAESATCGTNGKTCCPGFVCVDGACVYPTPTAAPTDVPTSTPTEVPTDPPTSTPTNTPTNTSTVTPGNTATTSPTGTQTPTETSAATETPTSTPEGPVETAVTTATATATSTPTPEPVAGVSQLPGTGVGGNDHFGSWLGGVAALLGGAAAVIAGKKFAGVPVQRDPDE
jgi:hypothetical protein